MNIQSNNWRISRRHMLRGLGASIALPMLDCMAATRSQPKKPKRSVFLYIPNGVNTLTWQIEKAGADYEFTSPLKSLERHRQEVTPISGLHHPMVLGKHHNCDKVWLTGADVPSNGGAFRNTISVDQLMAEVQGVSTRFPSLEMAIEGHSLAWSRDGIQLPAERNVKSIFERMFVGEKGGKDAVRRRLSRRGSILDAVLDDAQRVNRKLGTEDQSNSMSISPQCGRSKCGPNAPTLGWMFPGLNSLPARPENSRGRWIRIRSRIIIASSMT